MSSLDQWIKSSKKEETKPTSKKEPIKTTPKKTEETLQAEIDVDSSNQFLLKTPFDEISDLTAVELRERLSILYKIAETKKATLKIDWKNNSGQLFSKEIVYAYAKKILHDKPLSEYELMTQLHQTLSAYVSEERIREIIRELIDEGKLFNDDKDMISLHKPKTMAEEETKDSPYTLPVGSVSVYFKPGEGFTYHYDAKTYKEEHENPDKALLANLGILSAIWNKLIEMNLSPRYLSKSYDDDIYVTVLSNVEKETDEYMEVDRLRIHVSKHPLDAKIRDLSQWTSRIPESIEKEIFDRGIDFHNPMLMYQELKSKLKSQEKEKPEQKTTKGECARYTNEYIKQLIIDDPFIFDPRFQKIWDNSEFSQAYENDDWHTNSGHFNYVLQCWERNGGSKEELYNIILQNKDKHLHKLLEYWEKDLEQHIANMKDYAKSRDAEFTETWRQHSIDTWRELNLIREQLKLHPIPKPEILTLSTQEIISKLSSEIGLGKYTKNENIEVESESTREESPEEYTCEICGKKTDKLHKLRTGQYAEFFPDKKVCWNCYLRLHKEFYEKYGKCPECGANVHLKEWPNLVCDNGHLVNVNFIKIDTKKLLDDAYGKLPPEEYKKLHDKIFIVRDAIEEKYNKPVHNVQITTVNKSVTGVAYTPIWSFPISSLKDKIRKIEKITGGVFAGLSVSFNDFTETWMNEDLVEIEKPKTVREAEKYLRKVIQGHIEEDKSSHSAIQHQQLTKWTGGD